MKYVCQILLLTMPLFCRSQQRTIDSLKRLLAIATTDSAKFELTYNIGFTYTNFHNDSAFYYNSEALSVARKNGKKINEAEALSRKGFILSRLQRHPESFQAFTDALQIAENPRNENSFWNIRKPEVKDKDYRQRALAGILINQGDLMENAGRTDKALLQYKQALKLLSLIGDLLGIAISTANLGNLYFKYLNKPDSALVLEKTAESIFLQKKQQWRLGLVFDVIGGSYIAKHEDSLGLAYLYKAILTDRVTLVYRDLTNFYLQKKNKDSALYYARKAANIHIPLHPMDLGDDFENLARSYELNNKLDSAYKYKKIALATYDSLYRERIKGLTGFQQLSFDQQQQMQQLEADKTA